MIPTVPPILAQQKLVTVYLDNTSYATSPGIMGTFAKHHGTVEEHLTSFLQDGWKVVSLHGFGGNSDGLSVRGWMTVLLEKSGT